MELPPPTTRPADTLSLSAYSLSRFCVASPRYASLRLDRDARAVQPNNSKAHMRLILRPHPSHAANHPMVEQIGR